MLDEIGLFHRIVVVLDSRQEGKKKNKRVGFHYGRIA